MNTSVVSSSPNNFPTEDKVNSSPFPQLNSQSLDVIEALSNTNEDVNTSLNETYLETTVHHMPTEQYSNTATSGEEKSTSNVDKLADTVSVNNHHTASDTTSVLIDEGVHVESVMTSIRISHPTAEETRSSSMEYNSVYSRNFEHSTRASDVYNEVNVNTTNTPSILPLLTTTNGSIPLEAQPSLSSAYREDNNLFVEKNEIVETALSSSTLETQYMQNGDQLYDKTLATTTQVFESSKVGSFLKYTNEQNTSSVQSPSSAVHVNSSSVTLTDERFITEANDSAKTPFNDSSDKEESISPSATYMFEPTSSEITTSPQTTQKGFFSFIIKTIRNTFGWWGSSSESTTTSTSSLFRENVNISSDFASDVSNIAFNASSVVDVMSNAYADDNTFGSTTISQTLLVSNATSIIDLQTTKQSISTEPIINLVDDREIKPSKTWFSVGDSDTSVRQTSQSNLNVNSGVATSMVNNDAKSVSMYHAKHDGLNEQILDIAHKVNVTVNGASSLSKNALTDSSNEYNQLNTATLSNSTTLQQTKTSLLSSRTCETSSQSRDIDDNASLEHLSLLASPPAMTSLQVTSPSRVRTRIHTISSDLQTSSEILPRIVSSSTDSADRISIETKIITASSSMLLSETGLSSSTNLVTISVLQMMSVYTSEIDPSSVRNSGLFEASGTVSETPFQIEKSLDMNSSSSNVQNIAEATEQITTSEFNEVTAPLVIEESIAMFTVVLYSETEDEINSIFSSESFYSTDLNSDHTGGLNSTPDTYSSTESTQSNVFESSASAQIVNNTTNDSSTETPNNMVTKTVTIESNKNVLTSTEPLQEVSSQVSYTALRSEYEQTSPKLKYSDNTDEQTHDSTDALPSTDTTPTYVSKTKKPSTLPDETSSNEGTTTSRNKFLPTTKTQNDSQIVVDKETASFDVTKQSNDVKLTSQTEKPVTNTSYQRNFNVTSTQKNKANVTNKLTEEVNMSNKVKKKQGKGQTKTKKKSKSGERKNKQRKKLKAKARRLAEKSRVSNEIPEAVQKRRPSKTSIPSARCLK